MLNLVKEKKWILNVLILILILISSIKICSLCTKASDNINNFYGERPHHYEGLYFNNYYGEWFCSDYSLTLGVIMMRPVLASASVSNNYTYMLAYKPYNDPSGIDYRVSDYVYVRYGYDQTIPVSGNVTYPSFGWSTYNNADNGTWSDIVNIDGVDYVYFLRRLGTIFPDGNSFVFTYPAAFPAYELYPYHYTVFGNNDFIIKVIKWYEHGIKLYESGVNIGNVSASVDTSNIEQLIQTSNNINSSTDTTVKDIQNSLSSGVIGSGNGFTDEDRNIFKDVRLYIVLIFFCVGLTMFRTVIHQVGRNIRGK